VFAAGCGALAVLASPQTTGKQTGAKSTGGVRKSAKSTPGKAGAAAGKPTAAKSTAAKSTGKSAPTSSAQTKPAQTKAGARSTTAKGSSGKSATKQASSHTAPQQPTADRYKEIQQALADRGYFAGPVDGAWGASSMDALKRFQHDQNLTEDGKVGSLSLIALGLGPKRGATSTPQPAETTKGADAPPEPSSDAKPPAEAAPQ
jgi:peptidoglycan hydrolase-like protein with peptidoglycan-binding domain